jgi:hypothetical protein
VSWVVARWRGRQEAGYAAILVAMLIPTVFLGVAAFSVDTSRWYVEIARVQKAADAAALAGVTYMPADSIKATSTALAVASKNGYTTGGTTSVTVGQGSLPSQLKVTITTVVTNTFGGFIGTPKQPITKYAVADFTSPAPMGSPCNIFGNEPPSQPAVVGQPIASPGQPGTGSALPSPSFSNCNSSPKFWAAIEGPSTDKVQGDRYMTTPCTASSTYQCASSKNNETRPDGYYWAIHIEPSAVNSPVDVQIYDPAYIQTGISCSGSTYNPGTFTNSVNDYTTTDGATRYATGTSNYCPGDYNPGGAAGTAPDTTFLMREQTDTNDPSKAAVISGCTKQFAGSSPAVTAAMLKKYSSGTTNSATYNRELARVFHQWVSLCSFTPTRQGDYYLQVRTDVSLAGTPIGNTNAQGTTSNSIVYTGNAAAGAAAGNTAAGVGLNSFALRAVPAVTANRSKVAVAGWSRMPILQNASASTAVFNLIRGLPSSKGQYVAFDFYDAGDGSGSSGGTVRVIAPTDSTGSIKSGSNIAGCKGALNGLNYTNLTNCTVPISNATHDGQLQHMIVPIPNDYNCDPATLGGCWFQVEVKFTGNVTDFTTWDANIGGDPVRLVE